MRKSSFSSSSDSLISINLKNFSAVGHQNHADMFLCHFLFNLRFREESTELLSSSQVGLWKSFIGWMSCSSFIFNADLSEHRINPVKTTLKDCEHLASLFFNNSPSFSERITSKRHPELQCHCPQASVILVRTKANLREWI